VCFTTFISARAVLPANGFRCSLCGLRLKGREELAEAGLETNVELAPTQREPGGCYGELDAELDAYARKQWLQDREDGQ